MSLVSVASLREIKAHRGDKDDTRLLLVGLPGGGKTTLLSRVSKEGKGAHDMGNQKFHVRNLVTDGLNIICWDVGHGVYVDPYWRDYHYEKSEGIIFVVDASNESSFAESAKELHEILKSDKLSKKPVVVLANKSDLKGAVSEVKVSEAHVLHEVVGHEWKCVRTATANDEGIQSALEWIVTVAKHE